MSPRNSGKKPFFPNRRSAVTSIAVIVVLLVFAVIVIAQNNVSRLERYQRVAESSLEKGLVAMAKRFSYSNSLIELLDDDALAEPFAPVLGSFDTELSPPELSKLYKELDEQLSLLQKRVFTHSEYPLYAAYFEKIYEAEQEMALTLNAYNEKAAYYNQQREGFLASLVANRQGMEPLLLFSLSSAIQGRP